MGRKSIKIKIHNLPYNNPAPTNEKMLAAGFKILLTVSKSIRLNRLLVFMVFGNKNPCVEK